MNVFLLSREIWTLREILRIFLPHFDSGLESYTSSEIVEFSPPIMNPAVI